MFKKLSLLLFLSALLVTGCSTLVINDADFGWPLESVLEANTQGEISESRYAVSFNVNPILQTEFGNLDKPKNIKYRIIRDTKGFYFVTAEKFINVYVFALDGGKLKLEQKILVSPSGLDSPAFNQRAPFIELLDGDKKINLTSKGIQRN